MIPLCVRTKRFAPSAPLLSSLRSPSPVLSLFSPPSVHLHPLLMLPLCVPTKRFRPSAPLFPLSALVVSPPRSLLRRFQNGGYALPLRERCCCCPCCVVLAFCITLVIDTSLGSDGILRFLLLGARAGVVAVTQQGPACPPVDPRRDGDPFRLARRAASQLVDIGGVGRAFNFVTFPSHSKTNKNTPAS